MKRIFLALEIGILLAFSRKENTDTDFGKKYQVKANVQWATAKSIKIPPLNIIAVTRDREYHYCSTEEWEECVIIAGFETCQPQPGVDINKILDCFKTISDIGATCSIELFTDIPVDNHPEMFFNWDNGSPGHTFLQLKKSNLGKSMTVNIGLYPIDSWKMIFTSDKIPAKFVDDTQHEFNASIKEVINSETLSRVITFIRLFSKSPVYDIDDYNCTDFALKVFNLLRPNAPLIIPKYDIPGDLKTNISSTPQGLYMQLIKLLKSSNTYRSKITIAIAKTYAESSKIPCR